MPRDLDDSAPDDAAAAPARPPAGRYLDDSDDAPAPDAAAAAPPPDQPDAGFTAWAAHESGHSPDAGTQAADLAPQVGTDAGFVAQNLPAMKRAQDEDRLAEHLKTAPGIAAYAAQSPAHAAAIKDDAGVLGFMENAIKGALLFPSITRLAPALASAAYHKAQEATEEWEKALAEQSVPRSQAVEEMQIRALRDSWANLRENFLSAKQSHILTFLSKSMSPLQQEEVKSFDTGTTPAEDKELDALATPNRGIPLKRDGRDFGNPTPLDKTLTGEILTGPTRSADFLATTIGATAVGGAALGPAGAIGGAFASNEFNLFGPAWRQVRGMKNPDGSRLFNDEDARGLALSGSLVGSLLMSASEAAGGTVFGLPLVLSKGLGAKTAEELGLQGAHDLLNTAGGRYAKAVVTGNTVMAANAATTEALEQIGKVKRGGDFDMGAVAQKSAAAWIDAFKLTLLASGSEFAHGGGTLPADLGHLDVATIGNIEQSRRDHARLSDAVTAAEQSNLAARSPSQAQAALEHAPASPTESPVVYIDKAAFDAQHGAAAQSVAEDRGGNYPEASALAAPVAVPIEAHLAQGGPAGDARALLLDSKLDPEGITPREAQQRLHDEMYSRRYPYPMRLEWGHEMDRQRYQLTEPLYPDLDPDERIGFIDAGSGVPNADPAINSHSGRLLEWAGSAAKGFGKTPENARAAAVAPELLKVAKQVYGVPHEDSQVNGSFVYFAPLMIDGKPHRVQFSVRETTSGASITGMRVDPLDAKHLGAPPLQGGVDSFTAPSKSPGDISLRELVEGVKRPDGKPIIAKTGEPHGLETELNSHTTITAAQLAQLDSGGIRKGGAPEGGDSGGGGEKGGGGAPDPWKKIAPEELEVQHPGWKRVTPDEFEAAKAAKDAATPEHAGNLSPKTPEEYKHITPYLFEGGKIGFAVTDDGDAINLFNNGGPPGAGARALAIQVKLGARTLDCFDGFLSQQYSRYGFVETGRMKFDPNHAPKGWDVAKRGTPDIVFMAYKGGDPATLAERVGTFPERGKTEVVENDWEQAKLRSRQEAAAGFGTEGGIQGGPSRGPAAVGGGLRGPPDGRGGSGGQEAAPPGAGPSGGPEGASGGVGSADTPDIAAERAQLTEKVRAQAMQDPAARALHFLQTGESLGEDGQPITTTDSALDGEQPAAPNVKLGREFVREQMGAGIERKLDALGVLSDKPTNNRQIAEALGFGNPHELAHALLGAATKEDIDTEVQRQLEEAYPELARSQIGNTARAAVEAAHSLPEMERVLREINTMSAQLGGRGVDVGRAAAAEAGKRLARPDLFPPEHYAGLEREAEDRAKAARDAGDEPAEKAARAAKDAATAARMEAERYRDDLRASIEDTATAWSNAHARLMEGALETPGELELANVQHEAEQMVGEKAIGDINPSYYLGAERSAANRAAEAVRKGDLQGAIDAKKQQLLSMFAWRAARDARAELDATQKRVFGSYDQDARRELARAGQPYLSGVDLVMEAIGARAVGPDVAQRPIIPSGPEGVALLGQTFQQMDADGYPRGPGVEQALSAIASTPKDWSKLKPDEARAIAAGLTNIKKAADAVRNIAVGDEKMAFQQVINQIAEETREKPSIEPEKFTSGNEPSAMTKARRFLNSLSAQLLRHKENAIDLGAMAKRILFDEMIKARTVKEDLAAKVAPFFQENWKAVPKELRARAYEPTNVSAYFPLPEGYHQNAAVPRTWLYTLFLHDGSQGNLERFLGGPSTLKDDKATAAVRASDPLAPVVRASSWDPGAVRKVLYEDPVTRLSKEEMDFLQGVTDHETGTLWHLIAQKQIERTGMAPPKVPGVRRTVAFPDGTSKTYEGGYHHLAEDRGLDSARQSEAPVSIADFFGNGYQYASTANGFTKERAPNARYMVDMTWDSIPNHINQVIHDLAYGDWVRGAARLTLNEEFKANADRVLGSARADQLQEQIRVIATQQTASVIKNSEAIWKLIGWGKEAAVTGIVGYSLPMAIGQLSHLPGMWAGGKVDRLSSIGAAVKLLKPAGFDADGMHLFPNIEAAQTLSPELRHRAKNAASLINDMRQTFGSKRQGIAKALLPLDFARAHAGVFLHLVDSYTSAWAWQSAYDSAKSKNLSDEEAIAHGDSTVQDVMPDHSLETAAPILTDRKLGSLLIMHGFGNTLYNMAYRDVVRPFSVAADKGDAAGMAKAGLKGLQHAAMLASLGIFGKMLWGHGPQQDESLGAWATRNTLAAPGLLLPWLGGAAETVAGEIVQQLPDWWTQDSQGRGATDHVRYSELQAPAFALSQKLHELGTHLENGDREMDQKGLDLLTAAMGVCKVRSVPLARQGAYLNNVRTGQTNPRGAFDVAAGLFGYSTRPGSERNLLTMTQDQLSGPGEQ
jgi:hypothetical protein